MNKIAVPTTNLLKHWVVSSVNYYFYLSFCTMCIACYTYQSVASEVNYLYVLSVGISVLFIYNCNYLLRFKVSELMDLKMAELAKIAVVFTVIALLLFAAVNDPVSILIYLFTSLLCIGYFRPFLSNQRNLRDFIWLKPLVIGLVFSLATATIPYHESGYTWYESCWLSIGRLLFIASLAIVFDVGDMVEDKMKRVSTLPSQYGASSAKLMAVLFLMAGITIESYGAWIFLIELPAVVAMIFTGFFTFLCIILANQHRSRWFYLILVDGMIGLPFFIHSLL